MFRFKFNGSHVNQKVVVIGAGPAGLTAAYQLGKRQVPVTVLEADPSYVGGISRTVAYKGFHFDIGGHRFFSKSKEVEDLWTELLPNDMLEGPRLSRIFYRNKFFSYPLKPLEALFQLGIGEATLCVLSYGKAKTFPIKNPKSFEEWVTNQFGARLFNIFFKTYTEKVWGMSCKEISADWAAQRIKGLSLMSALTNAITKTLLPKTGSNVIKTLINSFRYPRKGPGMMWDACAAKVKEQGNKIKMGCKASSAHYDEIQKTWTVTYTDASGASHSETGTQLISTAPLREMTLALSPKVSEKTQAAARALRYRDFLTVVLIVENVKDFEDNWVYIHDPDVQVGRVQNFKAWSPEMVPDPKFNCFGLEYFCFENDGLWSMSDTNLINLGKKEIEKIGLASQIDVVDGCVVRQSKAYPVYDDDYSKHVNTIRSELRNRFPSLHLIGRNGMHKYNNQDHAMMTAMLVAENIQLGREAFDVWNVNEDAEYLEAGTAGNESASGLRLVPRRLSPNPS